MRSRPLSVVLSTSLATIFVLSGVAFAADAQELERLNVGNLRLYYTDGGPSELDYRGQPLLRGMYYYTAVKSESGRFIEGFNFRRNEDGNLTFSKERTEDGYTLTWKNKRHIYVNSTQRTDKVAGEGTVTLTITPDGISLRNQGKIEPNTGFGEVGFYISEQAITGGETAPYKATITGERTVEGQFPLLAGEQWPIASGLRALQVQPARDSFDFSFSGYEFPGAYGLHFQDYRDKDGSLGCYRVVANFSTQSGNEFDYTWALKITPKDAPDAGDGKTIVDADAEVPAKTPGLDGQGNPFGDARTVAPRSAPAPRGALEANVPDAGQITLTDDGEVIVEDEYFSLFPAGKCERTESREGDAQHITLSYDAPQGSLEKRIILRPDEAWLLWTVKAKQSVRGEVGFYCPESIFKAPCLTYKSINQSTVEQRDEPELSSGYCIVSGDDDDFREFQCGTAPRSEWMFQDCRGTRSAYRYVAVPVLDAGDEWRAVFRYVRSSAEQYPKLSFDKAREERGILATLLPDAITDGFTIVPARTAKYTFTNRPLTVRMKYYGLDDATRTVDIDCRLIDQWGRDAGERSYRLDNAGERFASIEFPVSLAVNGAYRMQIAYRSGEVARTRELVLTVMPQVADTGFRPDSVFGAAIGSGEYLGTLAKRIGLKWNRCHCAIGDSQAGAILPERGQYTWDAIENACDFHSKFDLYACHSISEGWQAEWLSELWKNAPFEEYLDAYVNEYVRPMAEHFKGRIKCWEVTNEPYYQFKDAPEKWVELMKRTYETLKDVDPDCFVVGTCGPPGSMGYSWYRRTFALGSLNYQDAVSSHLYHFGPWVGAGVATSVRKWMQEIRKIMAENGKVVPLWNSETTVTPPASMYTHPSHTRYVRYHPGEKPTDPVEQSQIYFKVLVMHKIEDVKYSFHIFHGGVEYTSHTGEYDETPLAFLAAQAALAKHLEDAEYVGDLDLHGDIQACLFKRGDGLILVPWGPMFLKRDSAQVTIPLPASRFTARDVFDNPLPVEGDESQTRLAVTWEAFFLMADNMSADELKAACDKAAVSVRFAESMETRTAGTFSGENAGPASRADWVGMHPVDLSGVANRGFRDEVAEDGEGGWTDEGENDLRSLPPGEWLVNGIPFRILDPEKNAGNSCIVLKGGPHPDAPFPESVTVPVNQRLSKLHVLHTVTWGSANSPAFRYILHYTDGFTEQFPVVTGDNVADWWTLGDLPNAKVGWEGPNSVREIVRVWQTDYEITHPRGAQATLDRIEIVTDGNRNIPVIIAITGVYSN